MALPTSADCKDYLRIEDTSEDDLVADLLARAIALTETFLGYALTAVARTHVDYAEQDNWGVQPVIRLPGPVKTSSPAPVVTDRDGTTVDATSYYVDDRGMKLRAKLGHSFPARPYTVVATIGLSVHPDYTAKLEAVVSAAIIDAVAHWYQNRNPAAAAQSDEGGSTTTLVPDADAARGLPPRVVAVLETLPRPGSGSSGMVFA